MVVAVYGGRMFVNKFRSRLRAFVSTSSQFGAGTRFGIWYQTRNRVPIRPRGIYYLGSLKQKHAEKKLLKTEMDARQAIPWILDGKTGDRWTFTNRIRKVSRRPVGLLPEPKEDELGCNTGVSAKKFTAIVSGPRTTWHEPHRLVRVEAVLVDLESADL
jgi:hypothetical protein